MAGRFDFGVRRVARPTAGVSPVVPAAVMEVVEGTSPAEKRTLLDARFRVGVVTVLLVKTVGLIGDRTLARRFVRRRAIGSEDCFVDGSMLRLVRRSEVVNRCIGSRKIQKRSSAVVSFYSCVMSLFPSMPPRQPMSLPASITISGA